MDTANLLPQFEQAQQLSAEAFRFLKKINEKELDSDDDSGHMGQSLQLILQFRLDTQDILVRLLHIERMVLSWLGIELMAGSSLNLDRIRYALGKEDLNSLLYNLSNLIDRLLKVTHKYQEKQDFYKSHQKALSKGAGRVPKYLNNLSNAHQKQQKSLQLIKSLEQELHYLEKYEAKGPVLDHIAALEGPINKFYQACRNGLEYSFSLYHLFEKKYCLVENITQTINRADKVLHQLENNLKPENQPATPQETLEARARKKRMGHFFSGL